MLMALMKKHIWRRSFVQLLQHVVDVEGASANHAWLLRHKKRIERARDARPAMIVETAGVVLRRVEKNTAGS